MNNIFFTSDTHFGHNNILKYCNRPFKNIQEHDEILIKNWNDKVDSNDIVYHLGDFALCDVEKAIKIRRRLNGQIYYILGNHDKNIRKMKDEFGWVRDYYELKIKQDEYPRKIVLSHYAHRVWNGSHHGNWHLFGHCVDAQTEILTVDGWKFYNDIKIGEQIFSYNKENNFIEKDEIKDLYINENYCGPMYEYDGKSINYLVTPNHKMVYINHGGNFKENEAHIFCNKSRHKLIHAANQNIWDGLKLTDNEIRLYIWLVADGTLANSSLGRIRVKKEKKKKDIQKLLKKMNLVYSKNEQKDGSVCYNFTIPETIKDYNIKGMDKKLIQMNSKQFQIVLDTYAQTDASIIGNSLVIYSVKEQEIDLLQQIACINGWRATKYSRVGNGFSNNIQYQLTITKSPLSSVTGKNVNKIDSYRGLVWCPTTSNGNWFCRRNGRVHLTGNSHGDLPDYGSSTDVGVDRWGYTPVSIEEIRKYMEKKPKLKGDFDHHGTNR